MYEKRSARLLMYVTMLVKKTREIIRPNLFVYFVLFTRIQFSAGPQFFMNVSRSIKRVFKYNVRRLEVKIIVLFYNYHFIRQGSPMKAFVIQFKNSKFCLFQR